MLKVEVKGCHGSQRQYPVPPVRRVMRKDVLSRVGVCEGGGSLTGMGVACSCVG